MDNIYQAEQQYVMNTYGRQRVAFDRGVGMYLYTKTGIKYLDMLGGIATNALGHSHPGLTAALRTQCDKLLHTCNLFYIENQVRLAQMLVEATCADKVFIATTGAEANEGAVKLARLYHYKKGQAHRNEVITINNSFHGRTLAMVAATAQEKYQAPYKPLTPGFKHVELNDCEGLRNAITDNTCAIMLELFQGEGGINEASREFIQTARDICDEKDVVLIFDEVQTGIGRLGYFCGYMRHGIQPDVFTLGKALGGGIPVAAICAKEKFCAFDKGDHGTTFGGNPFATAAGVATLNTIRTEKLIDNCKEMGEYLRARLDELVQQGRIKEIRGCGLMLALEFEQEATPIYDGLFERRVLVGRLKTNIIRVLPPLIIQKHDIDKFIEKLSEVI